MSRLARGCRSRAQNEPCISDLRKVVEVNEDQAAGRSTAAPRLELNSEPAFAQRVPGRAEGVRAELERWLSAENREQRRACARAQYLKLNGGDLPRGGPTALSLERTLAYCLLAPPNR